MKQVVLMPGQRLLVTVWLDPGTYDQTLVGVGISNTLQTEVVVDPERVLVFDRKTSIGGEPLMLVSK